jgi:hypothetical protein
MITDETHALVRNQVKRVPAATSGACHKGKEGALAPAVFFTSSQAVACRHQCTLLYAAPRRLPCSHQRRRMSLTSGASAASAF